MLESDGRQRHQQQRERPPAVSVLRFQIPPTIELAASGNVGLSPDGGATYFAVGTRLEMTILGPGRLSLFYWDVNNQDNTGDVTATVAIYTGPQQ